MHHDDQIFSLQRTLDLLKRNPGTVPWILLQHLDYLGYQFKPATNSQSALKLVKSPPQPQSSLEQEIYDLFVKPGHQLLLNVDRTDPGLYHKRWVRYAFQLDTTGQSVPAQPVPGEWPESETPFVIGAVSEAHAEKMLTLAEFCGLKAIGYKDLGKVEEYYLHQQNKVLILKVLFNELDGGFLNIEKIVHGEGVPPDLQNREHQDGY